MPQSTSLSEVDAKPGEESIFTIKHRAHVEFHRMPQSTIVQPDGCQEAGSEE
ncbi:MAG: hypothetical protein J1F43_00080 [Muribaculaceae bacterium]|nr:hypothetical protein [Muribaculaceae bacterium]